MKSYNSLRIVATVFQVIAWLNLIAGMLTILLLWQWWTDHPNGVYFVIALSFLSVVYFIFFLAIAQSIMLMVNVAKDVETITNNSYVLAEQQRVQYEKQSLENQQKIIALLSSLQQGGNATTKPHINPDDI